MKLKFNEQKQVVVSPEGLPVCVSDNGEDVPVDIGRLFGKVSQLNAECKTHRERADALEAEVQTLKQPKKQDKPAEDVEGLRKQMAEMKTQAEKEKSELSAQLHKEVLFGHFARSTFFSGSDAKTVLKPEPAFKLFGDRFTLKNGQVVALEKNGGEMYSRKDVTQLAPFEEALDVIMSEMGVKNDITRAFSGSGSASGKTASPGAVQQAAYQQAYKAGDGKAIIEAEVTRCLAQKT